MKDTAFVISAQKDLAQVRVTSELICHQCSAQVFCQKQKGENGCLTVLNPLNAEPGDEVRIEVPEGNYHRDVILLFGVLLAASLFGLGLGSLCASLFRFPTSEGGFLGLLLGLILAAFGLFHYFRSQKRKDLYPVITDIMKKGDSHG